MSKRPIGRPKTCWEDDVLEDIRSMNVHYWKKVAQDRDSWKKAVEQARTLHRLQCCIRRISASGWLFKKTALKNFSLILKTGQKVY